MRYTFNNNVKKLMISKEIQQKIIDVCTEKINKKGNNVGLSFYAFFENKNTNPQTLMDVANWWIIIQKLDHFEKALKIRDLILKMK